MNQELIHVDNVHVTYSPMVRVVDDEYFSLGKMERRAVNALSGVSFDIVPGEILGLIGLNGSGKSTLLRVLAGIIRPDKGSVQMGKNRVSLLGVGSGLMSNLSGHDNIYLIGMQLGFSKKEIRAQYHNIVTFAELEEFIDHPVRTYSSGMRSKLSFSIAVHLATEIMLIDELLSVGDMSFRRKSYAKMQELIQDKNHTVVIVSHDLGRLRQLCNRVLWLEKGKLRAIGPSTQVIRDYQQACVQATGKSPVSDLPVPELLEVQCEDGALTVIWESVEDATGYYIYRKQDGKGYVSIARVSGALSDRYTDKKVSPGQTYQYTVRAYRKINDVRDKSDVQVDGICGTVPEQTDEP